MTEPTKIARIVRVARPRHVAKPVNPTVYFALRAGTSNHGTILARASAWDNPRAVAQCLDGLTQTARRLGYVEPVPDSFDFDVSATTLTPLAWRGADVEIIEGGPE